MRQCPCGCGAELRDEPARLRQEYASPACRERVRRGRRDVRTRTASNVPTETFIGAAEIADFLGVSRQRVSQLATRDGFPAPVADLATGRVWNAVQVARWAAATGRIDSSQASRVPSLPTSEKVASALRWLAEMHRKLGNHDQAERLDRAAAELD